MPKSNSWLPWCTRRRWTCRIGPGVGGSAGGSGSGPLARGPGREGARESARTDAETGRTRDARAQPRVAEPPRTIAGARRGPGRLPRAASSAVRYARRWKHHVRAHHVRARGSGRLVRTCIRAYARAAGGTDTARAKRRRGPRPRQREFDGACRAAQLSSDAARGGTQLPRPGRFRAGAQVLRGLTAPGMPCARAARARVHATPAGCTYTGRHAL